MSNITKKSNFSLAPSNLDEAMKYAELIAISSFCPKDMKGKTSDVLVAVQMGAEVGLSPMQAIQNIAVINGRPSIWGDASLALVRSHPQFEDMDERMEGDTAYCTIKRKGQEPQTRMFSVEMAKRAGLYGKPGPWQQYPNRMLQMRARGFALRDVFPDALKGLMLAEEAQDITNISNEVDDKKGKVSLKGMQGLKSTLGITPVIEAEAEVEASGPDVNTIKNMIESATNVEDLIQAADLARSLSQEDKDSIKDIYRAKQKELGEK